MKQQTLSVALATYNDANFIKPCLDSIKDIANEIVVYDASSTDNTKDILKKFSNLKLLTGPNHQIFHINKQTAIDSCTCNWILQLDADEVVSSNLAKEILKTINSTPPENGFWINRSNFFLGKFLKKGGQYPDPTLRLYRRGFGKLPCLDVHEQAKVEGQVGHLKHDLLHYADASFSRYLVRNNRYTDLIASQIQSPGLVDYLLIKPTLWFFKTYFRHRGYLDGFPGFVFSFFSALRFPTAYIKYYEKNLKNST